MYRTKIDPAGSLDTDAAVAHLLDRMSGACTVCDDLGCLDCAADLDHASCTRACPACTTSPEGSVDWDEAWETTSIITELRGLERVEEAIKQL